MSIKNSKDTLKNDKSFYPYDPIDKKFQELAHRYGGNQYETWEKIEKNKVVLYAILSLDEKIEELKSLIKK